MKRQKRSPGALTLAAFSAVLTLLYAGESFAAAMAPDVDPSRFRIGNIFYPPGVKPAPGTETFQNGKIVTDENAPHAAITIQPKPKIKAKHKSAE